MKPKIFLSHSTVDRERVRKIKSSLEKRGVDCWLDVDKMRVGESLIGQVQKGLEECDFVAFFLSQASLESGWAGFELETTFAGQLSDRASRLLPVQLDDVEPPGFLKGIVWADLSDTESTEGVDLLARSIHSLFAEHHEDRDREPGAVVNEVRSLLSEVKLNPKFHWFIISGPSSAGKDVHAYVLDQRLNSRFGLERGIKYTTRDRRPSEPNYVREVSRQDFRKLLGRGKISFAYSKRHQHYGFDREQLTECLTAGVPLLSVYTHLTHVPAIADAMRQSGLKVSPIFIEASRGHLLRRVLFRNLPDAEIAERMRSIEQDLRDFEQRREFRNEYHFIENGDDRSFESASDELAQFVSQKLQER